MAVSDSPALGKLQSALSGRYAVVREAGSGGMATVYLARDVKHDRHVALKVLRPELGAVLGVERFLSEIKVTAHLQHPHLLPLFDSGEADGLLFYVMPFVEGESLRARLDREHQLPIEEALRITLAVASALEYAHKQGVIHRDLKPENILLQHGEPVVSDFGIALAVSNAGGARVTQTGLSLGTPQYMSPEQATGDRDVDARSDIYSLAAVMYEMLTGEPPHAGKTAQAIIARVLTEKPSSTRVTRDTVPEHVDAAVLRALSKLPADRFASAGEFSAALRAPTGTGSSPFTHATGTRPSTFNLQSSTRFTTALPWLIAVIAIGLLAVTKLGSDDAEAPVVRFNIPITRDVRFGTANSALVVSPDGGTIAISSMVQASGGIFLRTLDNPRFVSIPGTAGARSLFFSPDGQEIGFISSGELRIVPRSGGIVRALTAAPGLGPSLTWSDRNEIVFSRSGEGLWLVPVAGGTPTQLTAPDTSLGEADHFAPFALPGGDDFLFTIAGTGRSIKLASVTRGGKITRLDVDGAIPRYVDDGRVVFENLAGGLLTMPFSARSAAPTGPPVPVLTGVSQRTNSSGVWNVSRSGTLVHVASSGDATLAIVNRAGVAVPLNTEVKRYRRPMISPEGGRVVVEVAPGGTTAAGGTAVPTTDLWIVNIAGGTMSRLTFGATAMDPAWTRDGKRVAFARPEGTGEFDVFWQAADGSGAAVPVFEGAGSQWPYGFSTDGNTMIIDEVIGGGAVRISTFPVAGANRKPTPLFEAPGSNRLVRISKDGKWIAYASTESGPVQVFVRPFPGPGGKWQVSTDGGDQPLFSPNSNEIFYRAGTKVMVATFTTTPAFAVTGRRELFEDTYEQAGTLNWDVFPDGNRFVMVRPAAGEAQLTVTMNWVEELKRAATARR